MMHSILVRTVTSTLIFNFYVIIIGRIQKLLMDKVTMTIKFEQFVTIMVFLVQNLLKGKCLRKLLFVCA